MLRLFLGLMLIMFGGAAAAQQLPGAPQTAAAPKPAAKPAAKKTAKKTPPKPKSPIARELFGAASEPAPLAARSIGGYAKGCLAGGVSLPINGPDWQVMRLSRNRNWGNPRLARLSRTARERCPRLRRLARSPRRRHVAAARRADADRPYQPPGRARRRYLAHPHARPHPHAAGARGHDRGVDAQGSVQRRSRNLHACCT